MKKKLLCTLLWIFLFLSLGTLFINIYMIKSTEKQIIKFSDEFEINDVDAILVLGCKAYTDHPSEMLQYRLDKALDVYHKLGTKLILSGDHGKKEYDEVNVMRDYLLEEGVPSKDIFLDHAGFNTYDSLYRAKYVFGVKKIIIITQEYHLYRALYLANQLEIEAIGVPANNLPYKSIMLKNEIREILSRDKNFFKGIFKPSSKYVGDKISLEQDGNVTEG